MEYNTNLIRDFLWESYNIEEVKELLKKKEKLDDKEQEDLFKEDALRNLFLLRVKIDPGLNYYVSEKVKGDKNLQLRVSHRIISLFDKLSQYEYVPSNLSAPIGLQSFVFSELKKNGGCTILNELYGFNQKIIDFDKNNIKKLQDSKDEYFKFRLNHIHDILNSEYEINAINRLIQEYSSGIYLGHNHAKDTVISIGDEEVMRRKMQGFITRVIRNPLLYNDSSIKEHPPYHELISTFVPIELDMERLFFGYSVLDTDSATIDDISSLWKFELDLYTILDYEWFKDLSIDGKIKVLNDEYPFILTEDKLNNLPKPTGYKTKEYTLYGYFPHFLRLYSLGFYDGAKTIAEYIYENGPDKNKGDMADNIACCFREMNQYQDAKKWYSKAKKFHHKNKDQYHEFVEMKNCIEMEYYDFGVQHFKEGMSKLYKYSEKYGNITSLSIAVNIAASCKRLRIYDLEQEYINKCTSNPKFNDYEFPLDQKMVIMQRAELLQNDHNNYFRQLRIYDDRNDCIKGFNYCSNLTNLFQYSQALKKIEELKNNSTIAPFIPMFLTSIKKQYLEGYYLYLAGKYELSLEKLSDDKNSEENEVYPPLYYLLRALCKARITNTVNDDVKNDIENCVNNMVYDINRDGRDYVNNAKEIFYLSGCWENRDVFNEFVELFIEYIKNKAPHFLPESLMGHIANETSLLDEAKKWYNMAINSNNPGGKSLDVNFDITTLNDLFGVCIADNDLESAESCLKKILNINGCWSPELYISYAYLNIRKQDYLKAKKIITDGKDYCQTKGVSSEQQLTLSQFGEYIDTLLSENMPDSSEFSKTVNRFFETAEYLWFSLFKNTNLDEDCYLDLSPIIMEYAKGIETYLHEKLFLPVRNKILSNNKFSINGELIENIANNISGTLISLAGNKVKTISLGQISGIYDDINKLKEVKGECRNICKDFSDYLRNILKEEGITYRFIHDLGVVCNSLAGIRNGTAHSEYCTKDAVKEKRKEIINKIHNVIEIVNDRKKSESKI